MRKYRARVEKGVGSAARELASCHERIESESQLVLFPGTLNVRFPRAVRLRPSFVLPAGTCGEDELLFQRCRVAGFDGLLMRPASREAELEGGALDAVELMCVVSLRSMAGLHVGDAVEIEADLR